MSVFALATSTEHGFSKTPVPSFTLITGLGIQGDCHSGEHVQHRSRLHIQPPPPNLRQVHLIPREILDAVNLQPGEIGDNITTAGLDLLAMGTGTRLRFVPGEGSEDDGKPQPVVVLQGVRNPCPQIDKFRPGLKELFITRDAEGKIAARTAGVMATVEVGGVVSEGMKVVVESPAEFRALQCV
ncbi:pyruvate kinase-like protein [Apodospora peruviana]|uniref:Pyruvate kinase-like protein n=1 Tax=Apodospora peruviana TaxID=516989 RepID=A0AAE0IUE6_9PEZI|nr:pyruvate kinase-like protein [Apodospora peruviana]